MCNLASTRPWLPQHPANLTISLQVWRMEALLSSKRLWRMKLPISFLQERALENKTSPLKHLGRTQLWLASSLTFGISPQWMKEPQVLLRAFWTGRKCWEVSLLEAWWASSLLCAWWLSCYTG
ncbi:syndecan 1, isoform CRA_a [Rattus norvegicus]|uniref:Syndecan 1, isoform CRA_a n=1 Tax=Rattus norvegicus TaxID=10116 RepID=A6HAM6_RAT|nr:syndecan 1, isoform CRA_a [Rattus norvegicus]